ncbi:unnamed protein product, partial [Rotaria sp. Silwood2]
MNESQEKQLTSIIMDGDEIIETSAQEVVISESTECQKEKLPKCRELQEYIVVMHERKSDDKNTIIQHHYQRLETEKSCAGTELLCSSKNDNRIAVVENCYQGCSLL